MTKVLIVDDEEDILHSLKMLVEKMGYEVKTTTNGLGALNALKKEKFDLVLLDIIMPFMSGKEVLEKIRANPKMKNQQVAFLSVVKLGKYGEAAIKKLKPVEFFQKPLDVTEFRKRLKKLLR